MDNIKNKSEELNKIIEEFKKNENTRKGKNDLNSLRYKRLFKKWNQDKKPPEEFKGSSFLYIRSYEGDLGARPFSGIRHWVSPDLKVSPMSSPASFTRTLIAGQQYQLQCTLRNRGDLNVPSAKVEYYLVTPSLGFDTRYAELLGVKSVWASPFSSNQVNLNYNVPNDLSGHRCLFARTFSFSPLDIPVDDYSLNPRIDRHVAQLNLNITAQASTFNFQWIHLPNAFETLQFKALTEKDFLLTNHEVKHQLKFREDIETQKLLDSIRLKNETKGKFERHKKGLAFSHMDDNHISAKEQKVLLRRVHHILNEKKENDNRKEYRTVLKKFREMNKAMLSTELELEIPNFNLKENEVFGFDIIATNEITNEIKGGIRVFVTA